MFGKAVRGLPPSGTPPCAAARFAHAFHLAYLRYMQCTNNPTTNTNNDNKGTITIVINLRLKTEARGHIV